MNEPQKPQSLLKIPHYKLLALIGLATIIAWAALALVILKLDPYESTDMALSFFYISGFIGLTGTFTILLFFLKKWRAQDKVYLKHVTISLRQGFLLSGCTIICIALLMLGLLRVWNGLLLVAIITFAEFYFSSKDELD